MLATATEHHAVLDSVRWLAEHEDAEADWLPVDPRGVVSLAVAGRGRSSATRQTVALISVMWANNEVGTVQPIAELARLAAEYQIPFHSDAVQAAGPAAGEPGRDRRHGADHHRAQDRRPGRYRRAAAGQGRGSQCRSCTAAGRSATSGPGTLDVPAIRAFAVAVQVARERRADEAKRIAALRDDLIAQVLAAVPDAVLNGASPGPGRLPGNAHFSFPGCEGDALLMLLDARGSPALPVPPAPRA